MTISARGAFSFDPGPPDRLDHESHRTISTMTSGRPAPRTMATAKTQTVVHGRTTRRERPSLCHFRPLPVYTRRRPRAVGSQHDPPAPFQAARCSLLPSNEHRSGTRAHRQCSRRDHQRQLYRHRELALADRRVRPALTPPVARQSQPDLVMPMSSGLNASYVRWKPRWRRSNFCLSREKSAAKRYATRRRMFELRKLVARRTSGPLIYKTTLDARIDARRR